MSRASLQGRGVLVTRAREQAQPLCDAIRAAGGVPWCLPALEVHPLGGEPACERSPDLVIFVSPNAVRFGERLLNCPDARLAAIGPATATTMRAGGHPPDIVPDHGYDSESLLATPELTDLRGRSVLIVRGRGGRELLADTLRERGGQVEYAEVYERRRPVLAPAEIETILTAWRNGRLRFVTCLSVATLRNLVALLGDEGAALLRSTTLVSPSDRVLKLAKSEDIAVDTLLSQGPEPADIVRAMIFSNRGPGNSESDND